MTRAPRTRTCARLASRLPHCLAMAAVAVCCLLAPFAGTAQEQVTASATGYLGLSFNEQEQRMPASPLVGGAATLDIWQAFVGADLWLDGVDAAGADTTVTAFHLNYYVGGRAGIKLAHPQIYPVIRLFGLAGRAFPASELVWNPTIRAYEGGSSLIVGGGANVSVGPVRVEARIIQDRRFSTGETSLTIAVGWTREWILDGLL